MGKVILHHDLYKLRGLFPVDVVQEMKIFENMVECVHSPGQFKPDYTIGICCFSAKHTVLRSKKKDGSPQNLSMWSNMSACADCCFNELAL